MWSCGHTVQYFHVRYVNLTAGSFLGHKCHRTGYVVLHEVPQIYEHAVDVERVEPADDVRQRVQRVRQELAHRHHLQGILQPIQKSDSYMFYTSYIETTHVNSCLG